MLTYTIRRFLLALVTIWAISVFVLRHYPVAAGRLCPRLILPSWPAAASTSRRNSPRNLRQQYGLDSPIWVQYVKWIQQIARGNFGRSLEWQVPVMTIIGDRLWLTMAVFGIGCDFHLGSGAPDWRLLGRAAVFNRRLHLHLHRFSSAWLCPVFCSP